MSKNPRCPYCNYRETVFDEETEEGKFYSCCRCDEQFLVEAPTEANIKAAEDRKRLDRIREAALRMLEALELALDLINSLAIDTGIGYLSEEDDKKRKEIEAAIRAAKGE